MQEMALQEVLSAFLVTRIPEENLGGQMGT